MLGYTGYCLCFSDVNWHIKGCERLLWVIISLNGLFGCLCTLVGLGSLFALSGMTIGCCLMALLEKISSCCKFISFGLECAII